MRRRSALLGLALIALIGAVWLSLPSIERALVYFPDAQLHWSPAEAGIDFESVYLELDGPADGSENERIHGWWIPAPKPTQRTVLLAHGNGGNISYHAAHVGLFQRLGVNLLLFDYRGYGESTGQPSELHTYSDTLTAWHYLINQRRIDPKNIVIWGYSLGGPNAAFVADHAEKNRAHAAGLVLESTFYDLPSIGEQLYPWLPVRQVSSIRYPTHEFLSNTRLPVLNLHSRGDRLIPFSHSDRLRAARAENFIQVEILGGHASGIRDSGPIYEDAVRAFFTHVWPD